MTSDTILIQIVPRESVSEDAPTLTPVPGQQFEPGQPTEATAGEKSGSLVFLLSRAGGGSYRPQGNFSASLFEDITIRVKWNPLAVVVDLDGRTRRFHHPIPAARHTLKITTVLSLLNASGQVVGAPIRILLHSGDADEVSDTGLRAFSVNQVLEPSDVDMSTVKRIKVFDQTLNPAAGD